MDADMNTVSDSDFVDCREAILPAQPGFFQLRFPSVRDLVEDERVDSIEAVRKAMARDKIGRLAVVSWLVAPSRFGLKAWPITTIKSMPSNYTTTAIERPDGSVEYKGGAFESLDIFTRHLAAEHFASIQRKRKVK